MKCNSDPCTWLQHGLIALIPTLLARLFYEPATLVVGGVVILGFMIRELRGPGGLFASTDRIMDWVVPLVVVLVIAGTLLPTGR